MRVDPADVSVQPTGLVGAFDICRILFRGVEIGQVEEDYAAFAVDIGLAVSHAQIIIDGMTTHELRQIFSNHELATELP